MGKRVVGGGMGPHRSWSATSVATRCLTLVIGALEMGVALGQCGNGMNGMSFANLHNTFYYSQVSTLAAKHPQLDKVHKVDPKLGSPLRILHTVHSTRSHPVHAAPCHAVTHAQPPRPRGWIGPTRQRACGQPRLLVTTDHAQRQEAGIRHRHASANHLHVTPQ